MLEKPDTFFQEIFHGCPKSLENMKFTESCCPRLRAAPGHGSGMSLNHGIPGQLAQEPQSLAENSLRAEIFGALISPRLRANGERGIANNCKCSAGQGKGSYPPWIFLLRFFPSFQSSL